VTDGVCQFVVPEGDADAAAVEGHGEPDDLRGVAGSRVQNAVDLGAVAAFQEAAGQLDGPQGLEQGLRDAKAYGARSVLLVPAVVTKDVGYREAFDRSIAEIRKALPLAESLGVVIAIENVWNRFLLSPLEAAAYVDSFQSPFVRWHFDVGNIVTQAWPEQWIRVLGSRIVQVHIKEFSRKLRDEKGPFAGFAVELLQGDSDWPQTMAALDEVGYSGWVIAEQWRAPNTDEGASLRRLSELMDRVIAS
jgi:hexulose-6-phosphate isomerase